MQKITTSSITEPTTLYLPHRGDGPMPWLVLQEGHRVGAFATQDESLRFALKLADSIHHHHGVTVRLRFEDERGGWDTVIAFRADEPRARVNIRSALPGSPLSSQ